MAAAKIPFEIMISPVGSFIRRSKWVDAMFLSAANTAETYTVPAGIRRLVMTCPYNFWINSSGGTAAVPSGEVTNGTASEMNPSGFIVTPGDTISIVSDTASCPVSIAGYSR